MPQRSDTKHRPSVTLAKIIDWEGLANAGYRQAQGRLAVLQNITVFPGNPVSAFYESA